MPAAPQFNDSHCTAAPAALLNASETSVRKDRATVQCIDPIPYPCPTSYAIVQTSAAQAVAALQPNQSPDTIQFAPALLAITRDTLITYATSDGPKNLNPETLQIMDIVQAVEYVEVCVNGNILPSQRFNPEFRLSDHIAANHVKASATLAAGIAIKRPLDTISILSLVDHCSYNKTRSGGLRRTLKYVGRYAETPAKADETKLMGHFPATIPTGNFVLANYLLLPHGSQVYEACFLPPDFPPQKDFAILDESGPHPTLRSIEPLNQHPCTIPFS